MFERRLVLHLRYGEVRGDEWARRTREDYSRPRSDSTSSLPLRVDVRDATAYYQKAGKLTTINRTARAEEQNFEMAERSVMDATRGSIGVWRRMSMS